MFDQIFTGEKYGQFKSHYDYQHIDREIKLTSDEEIERLKKLKDDGYIIFVRLKLSGEYVINVDDVPLDNNYMYKIKKDYKKWKQIKIY